ncbi:flavodoxin domain-containing protein [Xenophilus sp. Marseille-Q4582]|uniref:flavodoxin domain-containing protein n=1 Tax=Xenophilus sp. Marseille-Q4582 TaxID=2866600 RepID=UPI001CE43D0D|nr:flavodoxin domain-containing protein [Xenophilus sp. Marseille-Q4582]
MSADATRWAWALLCVGLWLSLWLLPWRQRQRQRQRIRPTRGSDAPPLLVAFASQSGEGAQWAERTARLLAAQGRAVRLLPLDRVQAAELDRAGEVLLIASTTGAGDAPDNAAGFETRLMRTPHAWPQLRYGLLARGDRSYAHFCAFGQRLDAWLRASGATPAFERMEVDGDDRLMLNRWLREAARLAGAEDPAPSAPDAPEAVDAGEEAAPAALSAPQPWRLLQRQVLNAGSPGAPVHHLVLQPLETGVQWQAGDVARLHLPAQNGEPAAWREYSLASLPREDPESPDSRAEFLLREVRRPDGSRGRGSGWLCHALPLGGTVQLQLRRNPGFHAPEPEVPLVLIGNGTGLAGLVAHIQQREHASKAGRRVGPIWLLHGERSRAFDTHWRAKLQTWRAQGLLHRLDQAFSRDADAHARYVQDLIAPAAQRLHHWVADGAALYVCGQRQGMAQGVDDALAQVLGREALDALQAAGRYRRDLY